MYGFFLILFFYLLGEIIARLTGGFIPGSVIGMVLLFAALSLKMLKAEKIEKAANLLLDNMMLFFIPIAVGLISAYTLASRHIWAIIVASLISTVLVLVAVGLTAQHIGKRKTDKNKGE